MAMAIPPNTYTSAIKLRWANRSPRCRNASAITSRSRSGPLALTQPPTPGAFSSLISAGEDEGLDRVDQDGRVGGAEADLAQDLPVLQLGDGSLARGLQLRVGCVDGLIARHRPLPAGVGVLAPAPMRHPDRRAGALVAGVRQGGDANRPRASRVPWSRAAATS